MSAVFAAVLPNKKKKISCKYVTANALPQLTAELFYNYTDFAAAVSICKRTPQEHCNTETANDQTVTHAYVKQLILTNTNIKTDIIRRLEKMQSSQHFFTGSCDPHKDLYCISTDTRQPVNLCM